jgi:DNA-binding transcriptional LysR family regulator
MLGVWRLQLLREVARRGTIRAAAAAMSITPSAVSQQLKLLEAEAGVALLEHHGRRVRLTEAGEALVRHADAVTASLAAAESELATFREGVLGTHPGLRVNLRDLETSESLVALTHDEVDIAVVDEYDEVSRLREGDIDLLPLLRDGIHVAVPGARSAAVVPDGAAALPLTALREEAWIMDTESSSIHQAVLRACRRAGFAPNVRAYCKDYSVIIALVEAGLGVAMLPGLALRDRPIRALVLPIDPPLERSVLVAVKPERRGHPAVAAMLAELLPTV